MLCQLLLECRFSLFLRSVYSIARRPLPQKFTLSALAGKLARQVLEVTLAKARFCRALFAIKALRRRYYKFKLLLIHGG